MAQPIAQKIEKYGPYGSQFPENYSFQLKDGEYIKEVILRHGNIVDALGFTVAKPNGESYTVMFGGTGGTLGIETRVALKCGEFITQITGTYGNYKNQNSQCLIATMKIHTNMHPPGYGPFGQGKCVENVCNFASPLPCQTKGLVIGVFGRHNNYLESVGIFVKKLEINPCPN